MQPCRNSSAVVILVRDRRLPASASDPPSAAHGLRASNCIGALGGLWRYSLPLPFFGCWIERRTHTYRLERQLQTSIAQLPFQKERSDVFATISDVCVCAVATISMTQAEIELSNREEQDYSRVRRLEYCAAVLRCIAAVQSAEWLHDFSKCRIVPITLDALVQVRRL